MNTVWISKFNKIEIKKCNSYKYKMSIEGCIIYNMYNNIKENEENTKIIAEKKVENSTFKINIFNEIKNIINFKKDIQNFDKLFKK